MLPKICLSRLYLRARVTGHTLVEKAISSRQISNEEYGTLSLDDHHEIVDCSSFSVLLHRNMEPVYGQIYTSRIQQEKIRELFWSRTKVYIYTMSRRSTLGSRLVQGSKRKPKRKVVPRIELGSPESLTT